MANVLLSQWTIHARTDSPCSQALPQQRAFHSHFSSGEQHAHLQHLTGSSSTCKSRRALACRAVAAAEPAQKQLDVTKMSPLGDRLLVKPEEEAQTTSGGLLLSSGATKPIQESLIGEVLAVGEDVKLDIKVGSKVVYSKFATTDVKSANGDVSFVAEKSILATLS